MASCTVLKSPLPSCATDSTTVPISTATDRYNSHSSPLSLLDLGKSQFEFLGIYYKRTTESIEMEVVEAKTPRKNQLLVCGESKRQLRLCGES